MPTQQQRLNLLILCAFLFCQNTLAAAPDAASNTYMPGADPGVGQTNITYVAETGFQDFELTCTTCSDSPAVPAAGTTPAPYSYVNKSFTTTKTCPVGQYGAILITPNRSVTQYQGLSSACVVSVSANPGPYTVQVALNRIEALWGPTSYTDTFGTSFTWILYCSQDSTLVNKLSKCSTVNQVPITYNNVYFFQPPFLLEEGFVDWPTATGAANGMQQNFTSTRQCPIGYSAYANIRPYKVKAAYTRSADGKLVALQGWGACINTAANISGTGYNVGYLVSARTSYFLFSRDSSGGTNHLMGSSGEFNASTYWNPINLLDMSVLPSGRFTTQNVGGLIWQVWCYPPNMPNPFFGEQAGCYGFASDGSNPF